MSLISRFILGAQALCDIVQAEPIDMVLASMVGFSGLEPTIHAIKARKKICLANKETLVVAGELICNLAQKYHVPILLLTASIVPSSRVWWVRATTR